MYETPEKQGLYDPRYEHDACGIGFVVDAHGRKSHAIVDQAIQVLAEPRAPRRLRLREEHRRRRRHPDPDAARASSPRSASEAGLRAARAGRATAPASSSCRPTPPSAAAARRSSSGPPPRRACLSSAGATVPTDNSLARRHRARGRAGHAPGVRRPGPTRSRTTSPSSASST